MFPLVAVGLLVLLLSASKKGTPPPLASEVPVPAPTPAQKPPAPKPSGSVVTMLPGEKWGILARALKPMTDEAWSTFASNLGVAMSSIGATLHDFKIGTGNDFAYAIVPNIEIKLSVPSSSGEFRIERAERLGGAANVV